MICSNDHQHPHCSPVRRRALSGPVSERRKQVIKHFAYTFVVQTAPSVSLSGKRARKPERVIEAPPTHRNCASLFRIEPMEMPFGDAIMVYKPSTASQFCALSTYSPSFLETFHAMRETAVTSRSSISSVLEVTTQCVVHTPVANATGTLYLLHAFRTCTRDIISGCKF